MSKLTMTMKDWDKERISKYFDTSGLLKPENDTVQTEKVKHMKKKIIKSETKVNWNRKAVRVRRVLPLTRPKNYRKDKERAVSIRESRAG